MSTPPLLLRIYTFCLWLVLAVSVAYADDRLKEDGHIGILLDRAWGSQALVVKHVATNSPAAIAGIQEGDIVTKINGAPTMGMSAETSSKLGNSTTIVPIPRRI